MSRENVKRAFGDVKEIPKDNPLFNGKSMIVAGTVDSYWEECPKAVKINNFNETNLNNQKGNINMTTRKTVTVGLFDDSKGLDALDSLVFSKKITTDLADSNMIIQQILLEGEVGTYIDAHNEIRLETIDESILASSGNQVNLREVKLRDLRWNVKS